VAGLIASSTAVIVVRLGPGRALFPSSRAASSTWSHGADQYVSKLAVNQTARIKIIGAGEVDGKVRRVASTGRAQTASSARSLSP